ncbi:hypothetical protein [Emticicia sp. BO119]|uniref:hypothetical protein n=1 Tax=Emticicia sp. BO119 TaxID=2757768 RepID=UPI0015F11D1E|nr:hypothetical protein [Emticicia sp. BO119]MBA4851783.1 hypothetical protein [Emticicia sp. BO119]
MKSIKLLLLIILYSFYSCKKEMNVTIVEEKFECILPVQKIESPELIGGKIEMYKYILAKIEPYKAEDRNCNKIYVQFYVSVDGKVEIMKGVENCPLLKQKIITAFQNMPKWQSGKVEDKVTKLRMTIPLILEFD